VLGNAMVAETRWYHHW